MEKFATLTSKTIPFPRNDVDTDLIIPAQFLTSISKEGYGENLFRRLRDEDPDFPLNQKRYEGGEILVSGDNFGCGSSREHAVWAILGYGIKVVIAKSFADIFFSNSAKNGLLLITLPEETVDGLLEAEENTITVNLQNEEVEMADGTKVKFSYDPFRKHCLLNGLDDIQYILSHKDEVESYRQERSKYRYFETTQQA